MTITGLLVDVHNRRIEPRAIHLENGKIVAIHPADRVDEGFLLPGFVDAHVHIESSMLVPSEFARLAVVHGTVATVSDPHEIANVMGVDGVRFMIENGKTVPLKFFFGAPSCVPATALDPGGAELGPGEVETLLADPDVLYLSEMMNYPAVLAGDEDALAKIRAAQRAGKPVDGHAPLVRGEEARRYVAAGMSTDHECTSYAEAREKLGYGMKILIREGSAARNFDDLIGLMRRFPDRLMFCSDDKHPDELVEGHIDQLVRRAMAAGYDRFDVLRAACVNPVDHYGLDVGTLRVGDPADFIRVDSLEDFRVLETWIGGEIVMRNGRSLLPRIPVEPVNRFTIGPVDPEALAVPSSGDAMRVIAAVDGNIVTGEEILQPTVRGGHAVADSDRDLLKVVVVNRYADAPPAVAFVRHFGIRRGAIASSVAHDAHNLIAAGASDDDLVAALEAVVAGGGGLSVAAGGVARARLALPIGGLMADEPLEATVQACRALEVEAGRLGVAARPFAALSFLALPVIPALRLTDRGLVDVGRGRPVPLAVES